MRKNKSILNLKKEGNAKMRKLSLILVLTLVAIMATASMAFANHSSGGSDGTNNYDFASQGDKGIQDTYANRNAAGGCQACHGWADASDPGSRVTFGTVGPHGGYTTTSGKCITCHTIHSNSYGSTARVATNTKLLPGNTVTAVCSFCHDLTGTPDAPYSTRYLGEGKKGVQSGHFVEGVVAGSGIKSIRNADPFSTTADNIYADLNMPGMEKGPNGALGDVIPGGNANTGGTVAIDINTFNQGEFAEGFGNTKFFTCDSCHTPHGIAANMVPAYWGESHRAGVQTSRLLKVKPLEGETAPVATQYGSEWCAACHQGRNSMAGANVNHPVDADAPGYLNSAILAAAIASGDAFVTNGHDADESGTFGDSDRDLAKTNAWYAMTAVDPITGVTRNAGQDAFGVDRDGYIDITFFDRQNPVVGDPNTGGPACQQCHASARDVESSFDDASKFVAVDNSTYTGNPFTTFPHVSRTKSLLVENGDDFCTNCHGLELP